MIFNFAGGKTDFRELGKSLLLAVILISFPANGMIVQTNLTRERFSRLNVRIRAAYFENEILRAARIEGVDPNILWTICYLETRFRPWLRSAKNAQGLMQFIPSTAARFDLINSYEPIPAVRAAARYVKVLSKLFGGRLDSILAAYNSGEGAVSAYLHGHTLKTRGKIINPKGLKTIGGIPPYAETIGYVGRGLKVYRWLIRRGTFPKNVVRANFPSVIAASVARVSLVDDELGKVPDFTAKTLPQQKIKGQAEYVSESFPQNSQKDELNTQINSPIIVYYDSRSGHRYRVFNGKQTKLRDHGIIVITGHTRPQTTNRARSTFFAVPIK